MQKYNTAILWVRSLLYFIGSIIAVVFCAVIGYCSIFLPFRMRYKIISKWAIFCVWWLKITTGLTFKVIGRENIPKKPCIVISNHQSTWETLGFQSIFPQQTWILKKQLLWIPIFGWGLALLKPIIIDRSRKIEALKKIILQSADRLKKNIYIIIFPEGTRQPCHKLGNYQNGGSIIAKKTNTLILPVYHNAGKFWPKGSFIKKPGIITIIIGKAINPRDKTITKITKEVKIWAQNQALNLK